MKIIHWVLRIAVAIILLQTLYFKFTGQPESIYIFTKIGIEPWGRIGSGIIELIASILLLLPSSVGIGAILIFGTMTGAIIFHVTSLGVEVQNDAGVLFYMALFCWIVSAYLGWYFRYQIPVVRNIFK